MNKTGLRLYSGLQQGRHTMRPTSLATPAEVLADSNSLLERRWSSSQAFRYHPLAPFRRHCLPSCCCCCVAVQATTWLCCTSCCLRTSIAFQAFGLVKGRGVDIDADRVVSRAVCFRPSKDPNTNAYHHLIPSTWMPSKKQSVLLYTGLKTYELLRETMWDMGDQGV